MSLKNHLEKNLLISIKEQNDTRKKALRLTLSSIKLAEVESGKELDDTAIFGILQKEIKTREETIAEAEKAGREEMIAPIAAEITVLKEYLPKELSDDELLKIIKEIISNSGVTSIKEMGLVMKTTIHEVQGKASNDRISKIVRELLSAN